jgi:hypothetical protein
MAHAKHFACILILSATLYRPAVAAPKEAGQLILGDLYTMCTASDEVSKAACKFYILGVFEGAEMAGAAVVDRNGRFQEAKDKRFCVPEGLSSSAMELTVKMKMGSDLAVYPDDHTMPAVSFITAVIASEYPCHAPAKP